MIERRITQSASVTISEKLEHLRVYHLNIILVTTKRDIGAEVSFWTGN